ncbi:MAG: aminotransferase class V-fold PLP-dependent enzyme [Pseudomonadota bacterium]|nr:aminotransferase class V-fold PLP-dependent enzyme [Pseudomonadota bacterium]
MREAVEGYRRAIDRNPLLVVEHAMFEDDAHNLPLQVRAAAAGYLGGGVDEVALTRSTTESLALIYHGLPLRAGDEVLTTAHDHYSHQESTGWRRNARARTTSPPAPTSGCSPRAAPR